MSEVGGIVGDVADPTDRLLLEFESWFFPHYGAKAAAIRAELGLTEAAYFARLREIALAREPELVDEFGPVLARVGSTLDLRAG